MDLDLFEKLIGDLMFPPPLDYILEESLPSDEDYPLPNGDAPGPECIPIRFHILSMPEYCRASSLRQFFELKGIYNHGSVEYEYTPGVSFKIISDARPEIQSPKRIYVIGSWRDEDHDPQCSVISLKKTGYKSLEEWKIEVDRALREYVAYMRDLAFKCVRDQMNLV